MNRWISAVTLALVVWITVPLSAAEFEMVPTSELREMIKIVAPKFYREIDKISDTEFRVRVEKYAVDQDLKERGDTPKLNEWAQDILTRRQWCIDSLTTRIDQFPRDMAWEYVMNLGTNLEREEIEIGGEETFSKTIWLYRWKTGQKFAFEPDKGGVIPALLYPWTEGGDLTTKDPLKGNNRPRTKGDEARDRATGLIDPMQEAGQTLGKDAKFAAFPELEKVIRSNLNFSTTLPDEEFGDWPLWLTSFTRGDQFTDS
ncbi:MAG: hypothetical protein Q7R86_03230, partial [bacterium]|nr:hypothetical protein [bacterium]